MDEGLGCGETFGHITKNGIGNHLPSESSVTQEVSLLLILTKMGGTPVHRDQQAAISVTKVIRNSSSNHLMVPY